ncbi:MAG: hypothetical protein ABI867_29245 [Kofleriaceae bacterium]
MALPPELAQAVRDLVAKADPTVLPKQAYVDEQALLVYATNALHAYYLGADGVVYVRDLDRVSDRLEPEADPTIIRAALTAAATSHPELAALRPK